TWVLGYLLLAFGSTLAFANGSGDQVFIVFNSRVPESKSVAQHYAAVREVPAEQILGLDLPENESMSRTDFRERLQKPLAKALEAKGLLTFAEKDLPRVIGEDRRVVRYVAGAKIRYLVLCYGVPLIISKDTSLREPDESSLPPELRRNEAAVDSELACLPVL